MTEPGNDLYLFITNSSAIYAKHTLSWIRKVSDRLVNGDCDEINFKRLLIPLVDEGAKAYAVEIFHNVHLHVVFRKEDKNYVIDMVYDHYIEVAAEEAGRLLGEKELNTEGEITFPEYSQPIRRYFELGYSLFWKETEMHD